MTALAVQAGVSPVPATRDHPPEVGSWPAVAHLLGRTCLPGRERSVSRARAFMAGLLGRAHPLTDNACLIVSELVTNAILHSRSRRPGGEVTVMVLAARDGLIIEVTDDGSASAVPQLQHDPLDMGGRGLILVDALSDSWGCRSGPLATTVWSHLSAG